MPINQLITLEHNVTALTAKLEQLGIDPEQILSSTDYIHHCTNERGILSLISEFRRAVKRLKIGVLLADV